MARKLRWTLDFMTVHENSCHIDIYKEGYTGNTVTALVGAGSPFEYQEDNSTDLLELVRYKTGYLRLVESTYGELDELEPYYDTEHFIVVTYMNLVVFTGYIQCQNFTTDWCALPRVREFPVVSPLGLAGNHYFATPTAAPDTVTLGSLMKQICDTLNPYVDGDNTQRGYKNVYYPVVDNSKTSYPWNCLIHSTSVCPMISDFLPKMNANDLYAPESFQFFLEEFCVGRGWMLADSPNGPVFTNMEDPGRWFEIPVNKLEVLTNIQYYSYNSRTLTNYADYADDNATSQRVSPLKSLTVEFSEEIGELELTTKYATNYASSDWRRFSPIGYTVQSPGLLQANDYAISQSGGHTYITASSGWFLAAIPSTNNYKTTYAKAWYYKSPGGVSSSFTFTIFTNIPYYPFLMKLAMEKGSSLDALRATGWSNNIQLRMMIKCGEKYLNSDANAWIDTETFFVVNVNKNTGRLVPNHTLGADDDEDGLSFSGTSYVGNKTMEVTFTIISGLSNGDYIKISELSFEQANKATSDLNKAPNREVWKRNSGFDEATVDIKMTDYYAGTLSKYTYFLGNVATSLPTFQYLKFPQEFLTIKMIKKSNWINDSHLHAWEYPRDGKIWKIISESLNVREDRYNFVLANINSYNS